MLVKVLYRYLKRIVLHKSLELQIMYIRDVTTPLSSLRNRLPLRFALRYYKLCIFRVYFVLETLDIDFRIICVREESN